MTSLSSVGKEKTPVDVKISEPEPETMYEHCLFISDSKLTPELEAHLVDYKALTVYNQRLFTNRSLDSLHTSGVKHIYCDLSDDACREYLTEHLSKNTKYAIIVIYKKSKMAKFITDIKAICDRTKQHCMVVREKDLKNLQYISFGDFKAGMSDLDRIHKVPNWLEAVLSCGRNIENALKKK